MKIKICGMRDLENIQGVARCYPDFMGFIFYSKSPRNVDVKSFEKEYYEFPKGISRVGVFVDESSSVVVAICKRLGMSYAQLHGNESPEYCRKIRKEGLSVIKVFHLDNNFDFSQLQSYQEVSDLFLFDTKTKNFGGSGKHFDWNLLKKYTLDIPLFLSGGISSEDIAAIKALNIRQLIAIDVNSKVEISPGIKDLSKVKELILKMREE